MIRFKKFISALIISATVVLVGCGTVENNISLLQSPLLTNKEHEELKEVLDKLLPVNVEYVTPKKVQEKQSIFIDDINNDGRIDKKVLFQVKWINKESFDVPKIKLRETKDTVFYTDIKEKTVFSPTNFYLFQDEF
jgi:hypothetical protein